ncbi:WD40 repeat domain-containing protein [Nocardia sp. CA-135398]|uniref:WD40 repeat domain-containing protein n=1 Tax=Nocardia sp. CA-135398 TaxID=3239977 RepID=UPI003D972C74
MLPTLWRTLRHGDSVINELVDLALADVPIAFGTLADGRGRVAVGDRWGSVRLWDLGSGQYLDRLISNDGVRVSALTFARVQRNRDELVVAHADGAVRRWDLRSRTQIRPSFQVAHDSVTALDFAVADGLQTLVTGYDNGQVRVETHTDDGPVRTLVLHGHNHEVTAVARPTVVGGQRIGASGDDQGFVRIWNLDTDSAPEPDRVEAIPEIAVCSRGAQLIAVGSASGAVQIITPTSAGEPWPVYFRHPQSISALGFGRGPAGPILASCDISGEARLFDMAARRRIGSVLLERRFRTIACGVLTSGEHYLVGVRPGGNRIELWKSTGTGTFVCEVDRNPAEPAISMDTTIRAFGTGPDGSVLALTALRSIFPTDGLTTAFALWDFIENRPILENLFDTAVFIDAALTPGPGDASALLAVDQDDRIHGWDLATGTALWEPLRCTGESKISAFDIGWTASGRPLLIVGDDSAAVRIVEPSTGWHLAEIRRRTTPRVVGYCGDILCVRDGDGLSILRYDLTRW